MTPRRRWLQFSLRTMLVVFLVTGIGLALLVRAFHWANRGIRDIERVIVQGMSAVDAVEGYAKAHGGVYPVSFEEAGVEPPFTSSGYLHYEWYGYNGGVYDLYVYLGVRDGCLRWDESNRCWVTVGRVPYELRWTEREARELAKRAE
jgi:type II secretory pathway pseudopilin PulG